MSSYRVNVSSSRMICRYFASGGYCRNGSSCHYLHTREGNGPHGRNNDGDEQNNYNIEGSSSTSHKSNSNSNYRRSNGSNNGSSTHTRHTVAPNNRVIPEICKYFLEDRCRFGDSCWYKHEKSNNTNGIDTTDSHKSDISDLKNQKDKQKAKEVVVEEDYTCAICYDNPKVFGLLVHCDHIFCRDCIQAWRKTSNVSSPFQDVDTTKTCPVCRKNSPYFVPSNRYATSGPQKEQIISTYKEKISQIPCKYFKETRRCPFADECFYQHANSDGSRCILGPPRKKKPRSYIRYFSADGDLDLSAISEIIDGFQFDITDWDDVEEDSWDDEEDDYIAQHHETTDWSSNSRSGWGVWEEEFETHNAFSALEHDEECAVDSVDWRNIY